MAAIDPNIPIDVNQGVPINAFVHLGVQGAGVAFDEYFNRLWYSGLDAHIDMVSPHARFPNRRRATLTKTQDDQDGEIPGPTEATKAIHYCPPKGYYKTGKWTKKRKHWTKRYYTK